MAERTVVVAPDRLSVTLHTSWRHIVLSSLGASVVATGGVYAVAASGFNPVSTIVFVAGLFFAGVLLFDLPVAATVTSDGVVRRMMLRRQSLSWEPGDSLTRVRPTMARHEARLRQGGLVLRRGKRRYLLVDKAESPDEFALVLGLLDVPGTPGADVDVSALPHPPRETPPTWLYRRRRWRPDTASDR